MQMTRLPPEVAPRDFLCNPNPNNHCPHPLAPFRCGLQAWLNECWLSWPWPQRQSPSA